MSSGYARTESYGPAPQTCSCTPIMSPGHAYTGSFASDDRVPYDVPDIKHVVQGWKKMMLSATVYALLQADERYEYDEVVQLWRAVLPQVEWVVGDDGEESDDDEGNKKKKESGSLTSADRNREEKIETIPAPKAENGIGSRVLKDQARASDFRQIQTEWAILDLRRSYEEMLSRIVNMERVAETQVRATIDLVKILERRSNEMGIFDGPRDSRPDVSPVCRARTVDELPEEPVAEVEAPGMYTRMVDESLGAPAESVSKGKSSALHARVEDEHPEELSVSEQSDSYWYGEGAYIMNDQPAETTEKEKPPVHIQVREAAGSPESDDTAVEYQEKDTDTNTKPVAPKFIKIVEPQITIDSSDETHWRHRASNYAGEVVTDPPLFHPPSMSYKFPVIYTPIHHISRFEGSLAKKYTNPISFQSIHLPSNFAIFDPSPSVSELIFRKTAIIFIFPEDTTLKCIAHILKNLMRQANDLGHEVYMHPVDLGQEHHALERAVLRLWKDLKVHEYSLTMPSFPQSTEPVNVYIMSDEEFVINAKSSSLPAAAAAEATSNTLRGGGHTLSPSFNPKPQQSTSSANSNPLNISQRPSSPSLSFTTSSHSFNKTYTALLHRAHTSPPTHRTTTWKHLAAHLTARNASLEHELHDLAAQYDNLVRELHIQTGTLVELEEENEGLVVELSGLKKQIIEACVAGTAHADLKHDTKNESNNEEEEKIKSFTFNTRTSTITFPDTKMDLRYEFPPHTSLAEVHEILDLPRELGVEGEACLVRVREILEERERRGLEMPAVDGDGGEVVVEMPGACEWEKGVSEGQEEDGKNEAWWREMANERLGRSPRLDERECDVLKERGSVAVSTDGSGDGFTYDVSDLCRDTLGGLLHKASGLP